jgi:hypothetical protein
MSVRILQIVLKAIKILIPSSLLGGVVMKRFLRWSAVTALLVTSLTGVWGLSSSLSSSAGASPISFETLAALFNDEDEAVKKLADYMHHRYDPVTSKLKAAGFDPTMNATLGIDAKAWQGYSPVQKLAIAYQYADAAQAGGGERMLALLSQNLAREHSAAADEPALSRYQAMELPRFTRISFQKPTNPSPLTELEPHIKSAILKIAEYARPNTLGALPSFIRRHTKLSDGVVFDLMVEGGTTSEMLHRAVARVAPELREAVVKSMVLHTIAKFEAASYEPAFKPFIDDRKNPPDSFTVFINDPKPPADKPPGSSGPEIDPFHRPPGSGPGSNGARPGVEPQSVRRYREAIEKDYKTPELRRYRKSTEDVKGFGGIMLGNRVEAASTLGKPASLRFDQETGAAVGKLIVRLKDGSERVFPSVLTEDAYAAHRMIYEKVDGAPDWKPDEVIGVVGINEPGPRFYIDYGPTEKRSWLVKPIVLHPALVGLDLGNAAVLLDATPRYGRPSLYKSVEKAMGAEARMEVSTLFNHEAPELDKRAYLNVDVPLQLLDDGKSIAIRRISDQDVTGVPEGILRSTFIELHVMTNSEAKDPADRFDRDFAAEFYRLVPVLAKSHYAYHRINRFIPVLALYRWARENEASSEPPPRPPQTHTTDSILVNKYSGLIEPADMKLVEEQERGDTKSLDARIVELESDSALQPHLDRIAKAVETSVAFMSAANVEKGQKKDELSKSLTAMIEAENEAFKPITDKDLLKKARYLLELKVIRQGKQPQH